jgi:uncharacterized protein YyaL (SSP411 family)
LDPQVFERARGLAETMIDRFADHDRGGFFTTSHDHEDLIARRKDVGDHPIPAGSSSAAFGLLRLAALTGESSYRRGADGVLSLLAPATARRPDAFGHLLQAINFELAPPRELAVVWPDPADARPPGADRLLAVARSRFRGDLVLAGGPDGSTVPPLMAGRVTVDGGSAAYLCEGFSCRAPVTEPSDLEEELDARQS